MRVTASPSFQLKHDDDTKERDNMGGAGLAIRNKHMNGTSAHTTLTVQNFSARSVGQLWGGRMFGKEQVFYPITLSDLNPLPNRITLRDVAVHAGTGAAARSGRPFIGCENATMSNGFAIGPCIAAQITALEGDVSVFAENESVCSTGALGAAGAKVKVACHSTAKTDDLPLGCTIRVENSVRLHRINHHFLGCHSDAGYAHQARGLSAELLNGNAFEPVPVAGNFGPGTALNDTTANMTYPLQQGWSLTAAARLNGSSLLPGGHALVLGPGAGSATNRGFGNEGLYLEKDKPYEAYLLARSTSTATEITITLEPRGGGGAPFATAVVPVLASNWSKIFVSLTPNSSASCVGITDAQVIKEGIDCPPNGRYLGRDWEKMSDLTAHVCVACGAQLTLSFGAASGTVEIGYASIMPGPWGRYKGLPVRKSAAAALEQMGITMIRFGGSYATSAPMPWTRWRGPPWLRPSAVDGIWRHGLMSGWGLFEMVDLANAIGAEPVLTLDPRGSSMLASLIEYCWGGSDTTWGKQRIADGHAAVFNVTYFELGNEEYNSNFVEEVAAMEARAKAVGVPRKLHYLFPDNTGLKPGDAAKAKALGLGDQLLVDLHNGAEGGANEIDSVVNMTDMESWGVLNGETNCGDHTVKRMLEEAADLNMYFSRHVLVDRIVGRTASFCMERSGYNEGGLNDQGLSFFLPNTTWLQPPGFVHAMIKDTLQPLAVNFTQYNTLKGVGPCPFGLEPGRFSAQSSEDGKILVVRVVWDKPKPLNVSIDVETTTASLRVTTISSPNLGAANTPGEPELVSPKLLASGAFTMPVLVPPNSYTVFEVTLSAVKTDDHSALVTGSPCSVNDPTCQPDFRPTYPMTCPSGVDILGRPSRMCLPPWPPTFNMAASTITMFCNFSDWLDPTALSSWGLVDVDWSNQRHSWTKAQPMDCEERLVTQAEKLRQHNPAQKAWVYRNLVIAEPWFSSVREKLCDPLYEDWFLKTAPGRKPRLPQCDTNFSPPKCSDHWHDVGVSPKECPGGQCDCGCVPCGQFLWNHRNQTLRRWLVEVHATGPHSVEHPDIFGLYVDDQWRGSPALPTEISNQSIEDVGLTLEQRAEMKGNWTVTMREMHAALLRKGGFAWSLFTPGSNDGGNPDPLGGHAGCATSLRKRCVANDTLQHSALFNNILHPLSLPGFLLVRGPYAWLGNAWAGCNTFPPHRPNGYDTDYGEPLGHCEEVAPGVFQRNYTNVVVEIDCNTFNASIINVSTSNMIGR